MRKRYCMSRLLQALLVLLLVDTDVAERVSEQRRHNPGVPAEYSHIPSQAVLVSEMLVSPCSGYRFPPPRSSPADYCYDHALETIACAVIAAGGVELWGMVSEATTQDAFLEYFDTRYPTHCLSALNSTDWLVFIQNNFGASQVWVRDYAPALSIDQLGKPDKLLRLPYKKVSTNDISVVRALGIDIADQIGDIVNDGVSGPPTIYELPQMTNCFFDWGNFEADGKGMCLSTNWERTFGFCTNLEQFLTENAGCKHFPGDLVPFPESTKHVDIFARFYGPRQLLMAKYEKAEPVKTLDGGSATMVHDAEKIANGHRNDWVKNLNLEKSEKPKIADLPTPKGVYKSSLGHKNDVLVGYANVVLIQGTQRVLLFPTFGNRLESLVQHKGKNKEKAAKKEWMTKLEIQEQHVFDIVVDRMMEFGGGPHCITKQYQFEGGGGR